MADHATRVMSHRDVVECSGTEPSFQQEAAMFDEFARVIKARRAGDKFADQYWINVSLATQVVLDACFVSMKCDGGEVMIPQNIFSEYPADCIIS